MDIYSCTNFTAKVAVHKLGFRTEAHPISQCVKC